MLLQELFQTQSLPVIKRILHDNHVWTTMPDIEIEGRKTDNRPETTPPVVFKTCDLYREYYNKNITSPALAAKVNSFIAWKRDNPIKPFGGSDSLFITAGPYGRNVTDVSLRHAHLSQDLSMVYALTGRNPIEIRLYGVFRHKDLGTGNTSNIRQQSNMSQRMSTQNFI
jgi:hypothetical protein